MAQSTRPESNSQMQTTERELFWLQVTAGTATLIGMVGLLALLSDGVWAAEPPKGGLMPGARTFTSPFANPPGATPPPPPAPAPRQSFFDDDGPEDDGGGDTFGSGDTSGAFSRAGGVPQSPGGRQAGLSMGGGPPGGVVAKSTGGTIDIDSETGGGSKEVVSDFNFPDADIMDIAKALGRLTGKNFILDKDVKGRITIISNSPITVGDAWRAFLTALDMNGFAMIPSGRYIRVARQRDARDKQLRTYTGDFSPDTDALITRVFQLKHIDAEEVARTFRSFMPANSRIIPYDQTNTVIVTDTGSNIAKLNKMLELLDVEGFDLGIDVISVKYASASELSKLIDTLLPGTGGAPGAAGGAPRFGGAAGARGFNSRRTKEGGVINTIIADERTNTLIVNANGKGVDQVKELVAKLDQRLPSQTGGGKVHVIYLQFSDAEALAATLNNLSSSQGAPRPPTAPGTGGTGVNPVTQSLFEGQIKVAPDKATNSLVVTASPSDFVTVQRVVNRLDIPRDEVFCEVVIMEVAVNRGFNYSSSVISPKTGIGSLPNNQDILNFINNPISQQGAVIGFGTPQNRDSWPSITVGGTAVKVPNAMALVKAIQTHSKSNVLATPQIIALDNSTATFESSENIPVPTTNAVAGAISTGTTYQKVTLSIEIKPQINKLSNYVRLEINTKMGDIIDRVPAELQGKAIATLDRNAKTTVVVGDSDTVVIGGLMRDKSTETVRKVPLLGDLPLLGWLFKSKDTTAEKTNLMIFVTPHIVRQYEKVRAILDKKLKERDEYLETNAGGEDPLRWKRDDIIRNLPDLSTITAKRETSVSIDDDQPAAVAVDPGNPFSGNNVDAIKHHTPSAAPPVSAPGSAAPPAAPPVAPVAPPTPDSGSLAPGTSPPGGAPFDGGVPTTPDPSLDIPGDVPTAPAIPPS